MTVATTNGSTVWVFRYSCEGRSRSLFYTTAVETLRAQYPDNPRLHRVSDESRLVVSEPLSDLAGAWNEVPESSCGIIRAGQDELRGGVADGRGDGKTERDLREHGSSRRLRRSHGQFVAQRK